MSDQEYFQENFARAAKAVSQALPHITPLIAPSFPTNHPLRQETTRFVLHGGKRLRPALSLITAETYDHPDVFVHLALETFHKYLLAHDDIIDRDTVRNGALTLPAAFTALRPDDLDSVHFGNSLAIIAGNLLEAATQSIILEAKLPADITRQLQQLVTQAVAEVTWGWCDQFFMDYEPLDSKKLTQKRIEESLIWVTGRYSIKLPLVFGLAVAGQTPPPELLDLADTLGLLYQTGDDLIGIFGDQAQTGKSNAGDLLQGKKTLPLWFAYNQATLAERDTLRQVVGNTAATASILDEARAIIAKRGRPLAEAHMHNWQATAETQIQKLTKALPADLSRFLSGLTTYLVNREY